MTDAHTHTYSGSDAIVNIRFGVDAVRELPPMFSVGIHPWDAHNPVDWAAFELLTQKAIAIGECGIDKNSTATTEQQIKIFEQQTDLATLMHKPVVVHCVKAYGHLLQSSKRQVGHTPWLIHGCYATSEWIKESGGENFFFSVGPKQLSLPRTSSILNTIPPNQLLLETDDSGWNIAQVYAQINANEETIDKNFWRYLGK